MMMLIHVENATYVDGYKLWLSFNDGAAGVVDLSCELYGEIFEPLKEIQFFKSFSIEGHPLFWRNGADFAPEFLREQISSQCAALAAIKHHEMTGGEVGY